MQEYKDIISLDDLEGDQRQIAEIIGVKNYLLLVDSFGGSAIYIRKKETAFKSERNRNILKDFDGWNFRELALKYNLSERMIREIVSEQTQAARNRPSEEQISLEQYNATLR